MPIYKHARTFSMNDRAQWKNQIENIIRAKRIVFYSTHFDRHLILLYWDYSWWTRSCDDDDDDDTFSQSQCTNNGQTTRYCDNEWHNDRKTYWKIYRWNISYIYITYIKWRGSVVNLRSTYNTPWRFYCRGNVDGIRNAHQNWYHVLHGVQYHSHLQFTFAN